MTDVGLCAECAHVRIVKSARASVFYLCSRAGSDARFQRYPALPVRECAGFTSGGEEKRGSER